LVDISVRRGLEVILAVSRVKAADYVVEYYSVVYFEDGGEKSEY
jgi:hypothetical protein